jgi:hypothetical protein
VSEIRRTLEDVPVDPLAEERAWAVVRVAYRDRVPAPLPRRRRWPVVAVVAAAACVAAALSPPGRAVVDAVRRSIGVSHAAPALFRLPAPGRLLVSGPGGTWVVSADGSKRRLGSYREAAWSPHGLFVVGATRNSLAAIEPATGRVHWSLARPAVSLPRWGGTRTDTRIAYFSRRRLRVVAGDGTGDRALFGGDARAVAVAWRPETRRFAFSWRGRLADAEADSPETVAIGALRHPVALAWSADGRTLAAASATKIVLSGRTGKPSTLPLADVTALAFARDGRLAVLQRHRLVVVDGSRVRTVFTNLGRLDGLAWSPNGRWLVTSVPAANQWIFLRGGRVRAVSNISSTFGGAVSLDGWEPGP